MTRLAALLMLVLAIPAGAAPYRYYYEATTTTGACPIPCSGGTCTRTINDSTSLAEGIDLTGVYAMRITVCADTGTITGGAFLAPYIASPSVGAWARVNDFNVYVTGGSTNNRCVWFSTDDIYFRARIPGSRLLLGLNNSMSVSGGATCLRVWYEASMENEGRR